MSCVRNNDNIYPQIIKKQQHIHIIPVDEALKKQWITKVIKGRKNFQVLNIFLFAPTTFLVANLLT